MKNIDLVCLGEAMREFNQTLGGGEHSIFLAGFGGDTSNVAIAAARQGDDLMSLWSAEGVNTEWVARDEDAPTSIYFVTHTEKDHVFTYRRDGSAASRMRPKDLSATLLASTACLHVSGISQAISPSACDTVFAAIAKGKAVSRCT